MERGFVKRPEQHYTNIPPMFGEAGPASFDICVLIPCYNDLPGLVKSINSIHYRARRFVILVVDDGSTEPITSDWLYQQSPLATNIQILRFAQNGGITNALNKGLEYIYVNCPSTFIARLDCGDICAPDRFYRQLAFLEKNPSIDLVGSWCYFRNPHTGTSYKFTTPTQHKAIRHSMYFRNVFIHPTVMWRATPLKEFRYPGNYPHAEDYGLFYDIVLNKKAAIIDDFLVTCEINPLGISFRNRFDQLKSRLQVIRNYGTNKWWVAAGTIKLLVLMALPHQMVFNLKKRLFKV
jgi:glycosyltransferase involved in cell wall biosynthesis